MNKKTLLSPWFISAALAFIFTLLELIFVIYTGNARNDLSGGSVALIIIAMILEAGIIINGRFLHGIFNEICSSVCTIGAVICAGAGMMIMVFDRLRNMGLILSGVITDFIPGAFIGGCVCTILALIALCVVGFTHGQKEPEAAAAEQN